MLERVPMAFLIMGLVILVLNLVGVLLMFERNNDEEDVNNEIDHETSSLINGNSQFNICFFALKKRLTK